MVVDRHLESCKLLASVILSDTDHQHHPNLSHCISSGRTRIRYTRIYACKEKYKLDLFWDFVLHFRETFSGVVYKLAQIDQFGFTAWNLGRMGFPKNQQMLMVEVYDGLIHLKFSRLCCQQILDLQLVFRCRMEDGWNIAWKKLDYAKLFFSISQGFILLSYTLKYHDS